MNFKKALRIKKTLTAKRIEQGRKKGSFFTILKTNRRAYLSPYETRVMGEIIKRGGKAQIEELVASLEEKQGWVSVEIIKRTIKKLEDIGYLEGKEKNKRNKMVGIANKINQLGGEEKKLYDRLLKEKKFQKAMKLRYGSTTERAMVLREYGLAK